MRRTSVTSEWRVNGDRPGSAGGCPQHASFFDNPQFRLDLTTLQQEVTVTLSQAQLGGKPNGPHPVGFVVLTAPDKQGRTRRKSLGAPGGSLGCKAIVAVCPAAFAAQEQVSASLVLERHNAPYIIVPCTADPSCQATFALEVRSNFGLSVKALPRKGSLPEEAEKEVDEYEMDESAGAVPHGLGGKGYGFPLGGEGGEEEAAALVAKLVPGKQYEDAVFFGDAALYGDRGGTADKAVEVSWRRVNDLVGGGGGWGAQFEATRDAVLLPLAGLGERGAMGASAGSIQQRSAGAAGGAAEMAGAGSWLLGALAVLASSPEMARRCVVAGPHAKRGVLALRIWNTGTFTASHGMCMACAHNVCA